VTDEGIALCLSPGPVPLPVRVDPQQFQNALLNLAINARDAMPRGGTLTIGAARREVGPDGDRAHPTLAPGAYVTVTVADTGTGMSPEAVARAVEPFYTTKAPGKGSGLGLSMAYRFARQAGGGLRIDSAPGEGTCVVMLLPEAPAAAAAGSPAPASAVAAVLPRGAAAGFTKLHQSFTGR
jgi:signal transduction histidine kinase